MAPVINEICAYHFFLCMILFISINIIIPDIFIKNKRSILVVYQVDMFTHTKPLERKLRTQGALSIDFTRFYRLSNFTTVSTCLVAVILMTIGPGTPLASGYIFNNSGAQHLFFTE